jgi:hypothetical protein
MTRSIVAVIIGFMVASAIMMIVETANTRVLYPDLAALAASTDAQVVHDMQASAPAGAAPDARELALRRREALRGMMASAPTGALLVVVAGWILGSVAGAFAAAWIGRCRPIAHGLVLGVLLMLAGIANNLMLPPPAWFWIVTFIVFLPATYLGARLAGRRRGAAPAS